MTPGSVDSTSVLLWTWLTRGRFTLAGVVLVGIGLLAPLGALTYVHLVGRSAVTPSTDAASTAAAFMQAVQRQDLATEQRLLSPDARAGARQFASAPFSITRFATQGSDVFWGYRFAVEGHPGVSQVRLLVSCASHSCGIREVLTTA